MRTSRLIPGILLALLFSMTGCGDGAATAPGPEHDLELRWETGMKYRVREERTERSGSGLFPPAAEIESRALTIHRTLHIYEDEVLEADGGRLYRVRRNYLTSVAGPENERRPTPLNGETYEIHNPLPGGGALELWKLDENGKSVPPSAEETRQLESDALRLAAAHLPDRPVPDGGSWRSGRNLSTLEVDPTTPLVRLEAVEPGKTARLAWRPRGRLRTQGETTVAIDETLALDLAGRRIGAYWSSAEYQSTKPGPKWRQVSIELSVTPMK